MTSAAVQRARQRRQTGALGVNGQEGGKEQLQAGTISIGATNYACAVHLGKIEYVMDESTGLWRQIQPLMVTVRKELLAVAPPKKSVIAFSGANYQVDEVGGQNSLDLVWGIRAKRKLPSPT